MDPLRAPEEGRGAPGGDAMPEMRMSAAATRPQITAVTVLSVLILAVGVLLGALYGELTMARGMANPDAMPANMRMPR